MRTVEAHATVTTGPDRVCESIADPNRWTEWLVLHESWKGEPPAAAVEGLSATATAAAMTCPSPSTGPSRRWTRRTSSA